MSSQYDATFIPACRVTAVGDDGTYTVRVKGRPYGLPGCTSAEGSKYQVGDVVDIANSEGNRNIPSIIGHSAYK